MGSDVLVIDKVHIQKTRYPPLSHQSSQSREAVPLEFETAIFLPGKVNVSDSLKGTLETILVVDDHEMVRKVVVEILELADFRVLSAENGPAALKLAEQTDRKIDLLLSDVDMRKRLVIHPSAAGRRCGILGG